MKHPYLFFISIATAATACSPGWKYQQDNLPEELVEEAIDLYTGTDIDLSPATPEHGFNPKALAPVVRVP